MHDLLEMDLSGFNVREKPETPELLEQKLQSLEPIPRWWYECLQAGGVDEDDKWPEFIGTRDSIDRIVKLAGKKLYKEPTPLIFKKAMRELCPSAKNDQQNTGFGSRQRGLALPPLERCRKEFEAHIGAIDWTE